MDSRAPAKEIARAALEKGLRAICFTTHIDLNPERIGLDGFMRIGGRFVRLSENTVRRYLLSGREIAAEYRGRLEVLTGFEFSYRRHFRPVVAAFIEKYEPDFVLGAVHSLENIAMTSSREAPGYYRNHSAGEAAEDYVAATSELVESGLFRTIAHLDAVKKYGRDFFGEAIEDAFAERVKPLLTEMSAAGVGIEINTSALRKGFSEMYPSRKILRMAADAGVAVNSVGSDAHRVSDVAYAIPEALELIREMKLPVGEPPKQPQER